MNVKRMILLILSGLLMIGLVGCGTTPEPTQQPEPPEPPQIVYMLPQPGEELPLDGVITVYFDHPIDSESVDVTTNPSLELALNWVDDKALEVTPADLTRAFTYTLHVTGESTEGLALDESVEFNTIGLLRVTEVIPANQSIEIDINSEITIFFNRPVVPLSLLGQSEDFPQPLHFDPAIPGEGEWLNTSIYIWRPDQRLKGGQQYTATIDALTSQDGAEMTGPHTWHFTTSVPTVTRTWPSPNREGVGLTQQINLQFSQPMDPASVESAFTVTSVSTGSEVQNEKVVSGTFEWSEDGTGFTFTPDEQLDLETTYTAVLTKDAGASDGSIGLANNYAWSFQTVGYPRIVATLPEANKTDISPLLFDSIKIGISAPLDPESLGDKLRISPMPPGDIEIYIDNSYTFSDVTLRTILDDNTEYTVTLLPGLSDPYGNTIDEEFSFSFTTGEYPPQFILSPEEWLSILDIRQTTDLLAFVRNVDQMDYKLYRLPVKALSSVANGWDFDQFNPATQEVVREWSEDTSQVDENTGYNWRISLDDLADNQPLEPGVYIFTAKASGVQRQAKRLIILANANIVTKHSHSQAMAWVTDLRTGEPLPNVEVTFYTEAGYELGSAVSDQDGLAFLTFDRTLSKFLDIIAVAESDGIYGVTYTDWGMESYQYVPRYSPKFIVYPYTDRPIYRPGHEVFFKAIIRARDDAAFELPGEEPVMVRVWNPENEIIFEQGYTISEFGSIDGTFQLDQEAAAGRYYLEVTMMEDTDWEINEDISFQVAEYVRPEFQAAITPDKPEVVENEPVTVELDAIYFFGGPVQQGTVTWDVFAQPYYFRPDIEGRSYSFIDYDRNVPIDADYIPGFGRKVIELEGQLNPDGTYSLDLPTELAEFPGSQRFTIEAGITDGSNQFVTASTEVIVHKGNAYAGVRPERYINQAGEPANIEMITLDREGEILAGQPVEMEIIQIKTYSVQEISPSGYTYWENTTEEISIMQRSVLSGGDGTVVIPFTPVEAGSYKIVASTTDQEGRPQRSTAYLWVSGGTRYVSWGQPNSYTIDLVTDKSEYKPGDTAQIMVPVPFAGENVRALVTVERNNVLLHEVIELDSNSFVYELPITADYSPNVYFTVILIKGADSQNPLANFRTGRVRLDVDTSSFELGVSVTADVPEASPGDDVTYRVKVVDADGNPVKAEVSFALVDLATLKLAPPNSPLLMDFFYRNIPHDVWTSLSLVHLEEPIPEELFDQAKGGSGGIGDSFYDLRRDFKDTAYWNAAVQTDENGIAEVTVHLPDNLTTWNMDVRAVTPEGKVGQTTHELMSTEELLIRPVTPRFFVVGDHVTLAALAYNNSGQPLDAVISMVGDGYTLESGSVENEVSIPNGGVVRVEWPVRINTNAEWVDLTFTVDAGSLRDSTKPPVGDPDHDQMLRVYRFAVSETTATAGQLTDAGRRTETIFIPPDLTLYDATVDVTLDFSLAGAMTESLAWLENYPHQCTEQTVSRFLANVYTLRVLHELGIDRPELEQHLETVINPALQRLYTQQHPDGGWGWFVSDTSSTLVTAYVVQGMLAARDAGYTIDEPTLNLALDYLDQALGRVELYRDDNRQAYILYVLALAGKPDPGRTDTLFNSRSELDIWATALLTQAIWVLNPDDPRLDTLQSDLVSAASLSASGAHWSESRPGYLNWVTDTRTTAIVLDTFAQVWPENELNPNAVRWLMQARQNDRWETTQETTWAIIALSDWMAVSGDFSPEYDWTLTFNQVELLAGSIVPEQALESTNYTITLAELMEANNVLTFSRSSGDGNLYYTAQLNSDLPVEEIKQASKGFVVTRRYLNEDGQPVEGGVVSETLTVELTIIVQEDQHYIYIEDPFPAGASGIDSNLLTESLADRPMFSYGEGRQSWGWWWFSQVQIRDEKAVLYAERLPAGTYVFTYQLRLGVPGEYHVMPAIAQNFYFPDVYGRTGGTLFVIEPSR